MTRIDHENLKRPGGPGLGSPEVGAGCGLHKNSVFSTLIDLSAGASATTIMCPTTNCTLQRVAIVFVAADTAATTFDLGYIRAGTTDADYFVAADATAGSGTEGTIEDFTLTQTRVLAGDQVQYTVTNSASTGTGHLVIEYTIDDEE